MIKIWDTRKNFVLTRFWANDTVTGMKLSPDGPMLTNAMDNTVRMWDVRPLSRERCVKMFWSLFNLKRTSLRLVFQMVNWRPEVPIEMYMSGKTASRKIALKLPGTSAASMMSITVLSQSY